MAAVIAVAWINEEDVMATYDHSAPMGATGLPQPPRWVCVLLGLFMVFAGLMVLGDVAFFTVISALLPSGSSLSASR